MRASSQHHSKAGHINDFSHGFEASQDQNASAELNSEGGNDEFFKTQDGQ